MQTQKKDQPWIQANVYTHKARGPKEGVLSAETPANSVVKPELVYSIFVETPNAELC